MFTRTRYDIQDQYYFAEDSDGDVTALVFLPGSTGRFPTRATLRIFIFNELIASVPQPEQEEILERIVMKQALFLMGVNDLVQELKEPGETVIQFSVIDPDTGTGIYRLRWSRGQDPVQDKPLEVFNTLRSAILAEISGGTPPQPAPA